MFKDDERKQAQQHNNFIDELAVQASMEAEYEVPRWNRAAAFEQSSSRYSSDEIRPWWHWQSFGGLAFATSFSVIALVNVLVNKGEVIDQQVIAQLVKDQVTQQLDVEVNRKLKAFANEQQLILANYKAEISERQAQKNLQLAGYVISATRTERKEDLNDFVSFINAQRKDEQLDQKIRFKQLEQAISYRNANYIDDTNVEKNATSELNKNFEE